MSYLQSLNWKKELLNSSLIFIFGGLTMFIWCFDCFSSISDYVYSYIFTGLMWFLLWQGNGLLSDYISSKVSWLEHPPKRFIYGILGVLIYTPIAVYGLNLIANGFFGVNIRGIGETAIIAIGITFVISFFLNAASFFRNWRQAALDAERLKKEQMATKYESLKNQVNPHFLFNSLNALTNLVYEDQDRAAEFIRQLSKVYRYVLETRAKELVSLSEELKFVDAYLMLQKARFDDKLLVNINIEDEESKQVPPISLQILIENAIKHNIISEDDPLRIDVTIEDNRLVVSNNLQKKKIPIEESAGMGLPNIIARFEFLTDQKVEILDGPEKFIVKLPLLNVES